MTAAAEPRGAFDVVVRFTANAPDAASAARIVEDALVERLDPAAPIPGVQDEPHAVIDSWQTIAPGPIPAAASRTAAAERGSLALQMYDRIAGPDPQSMETAAPRLVRDILARCAEEDERLPVGVSCAPRDIVARAIRLLEGPDARPLRLPARTAAPLDLIGTLLLSALEGLLACVEPDLNGGRPEEETYHLDGHVNHAVMVATAAAHAARTRKAGR